MLGNLDLKASISIVPSTCAHSLFIVARGAGGPKLDVLWDSGWLWLVGKDAQQRNEMQEHSCDDRKILLCVGKVKGF